MCWGASGVVGQIAVQGGQAARRRAGGGRGALARWAWSAAWHLGADAAVRLDEPGDLPAALSEAGEGRIDVVVDPLFGEPFVAAVERGELRCA